MLVLGPLGGQWGGGGLRMCGHLGVGRFGTMTNQLVQETLRSRSSSQALLTNLREFESLIPGSRAWERVESRGIWNGVVSAFHLRCR